MKQSSYFKRRLPKLILILGCFFLLPSLLIAQKRKPVNKPPSNIEASRIVNFEILENGDTINRLDQYNKKHGRWLIETPARYDEPAIIEIGQFDMNEKTGRWKTYTSDGVIIMDENFKSGLKNGEARYYENGRLFCIGNYLALNAKNTYDTILVELAESYEFKKVIVKTSVGSIRHGMWTYYKPYSKKINRVVEYQADEIVYEKDYDELSGSDSLKILAKLKSFPHVSNKSSEEGLFEKKKMPKIRYTDFPDNTEYVKPNVRKK